MAQHDPRLRRRRQLIALLADHDLKAGHSTLSRWEQIIPFREEQSL